MLERFFKFRQRNTSFRRDSIAGDTTFMVMSYVILVNPHILGLSGKGLPFSASLTSTCLVAGGSVGASSATTHIESGAGVAQGGRTGCFVLTVGALFLACMWISPLASFVPANVTAPALIIVGFLMIATLTRGEAAEKSFEHKAAINFANLEVGIPALLIMTIIPLTYSITNGIGFGFISYAVIGIVRGRLREVSWMLRITSAAFPIYSLAPLFQAKGWI